VFRGPHGVRLLDASYVDDRLVISLHLRMLSRLRHIAMGGSSFRGSMSFPQTNQPPLRGPSRDNTKACRLYLNVKFFQSSAVTDGIYHSTNLLHSPSSLGRCFIPWVAVLRHFQFICCLSSRPSAVDLTHNVIVVYFELSSVPLMPSSSRSEPLAAVSLRFG
jgi:hypothetical protein